jgi:hypothetical protein
VKVVLALQISAVVGGIMSEKPEVEPKHLGSKLRLSEKDQAAREPNSESSVRSLMRSKVLSSVLLIASESGNSFMLSYPACDIGAIVLYQKGTILL